MLEKNHRDEQYLARRNLRDLPGEIGRLDQRRARLEADRATAEAHREDELVVGTRAVAKEDAAIVLGKRLNEIPDQVDRTKRYPLGKSRGLEFGLILHHLGGTEVYVEGEANRKTSLARDNPGARAVLNAVDRLMWKAGDEIEGYRADIRLKEGQLRDYEARVGTPFAHENYASQLADLRDKLKLSLSEKPPEGTLPASELSAQIHAVRDGNAVEAAPERTARKAARAERPVTARIRERLAPKEVKVDWDHAGDEVQTEVSRPVEASQELHPAPTAEVIPLPVAATSNAVTEASSVPAAAAPTAMPAMYQERGHAGRVTKKRQADGAQLRLF